MANVLTVPFSSIIYFDDSVAGSNTVPSLTSLGVGIRYNDIAGIVIESFNTDLSASERFRVDGSVGNLFTVTDALTGDIFSVNDIAGLPLINVNSTTVDIITMGTYGTNALVISGGIVGVGTDTPTSTLHLSGSLAKKIQRNTTNTTIDDTAYQWNGNTNGGSFTYILPVGVQDRCYKIVNTGLSGNTLSLSANGAETLLGLTTPFDLSDGESMEIGFDSTDGWW